MVGVVAVIEVEVLVGVDAVVVEGVVALVGVVVMGGEAAVVVDGVVAVTGVGVMGRDIKVVVVLTGERRLPRKRLRARSRSNRICWFRLEVGEVVVELVVGVCGMVVVAGVNRVVFVGL